MKNPRYSVVIPVHNEAQSLPQLLQEITQTMKGSLYEIIVVNDASTDRTRAVISQLCKKFPQLRTASLRQHAGKWAALRTGISISGAPIIITLDGDLQDDPRQLPKLLTKIHRFDVVSATRMRRRDPQYKVILTAFANVVVSRISGYTFADFASAMKVYKRSALDALPRDGSLLRYSLLFAHKLNLRIIEVPVFHRPRIHGKSKFGIVKYFRIFYDLVLIFLLFTGSGSMRKTT